jgi:hypothetical protein
LEGAQIKSGDITMAKITSEYVVFLSVLRSFLLLPTFANMVYRVLKSEEVRNLRSRVAELEPLISGLQQSVAVLESNMRMFSCFFIIFFY